MALTAPVAAQAIVDIGAKRYRVVLLQAGRFQVWEGERRVMDQNEEIAAVLAVALGMATQTRIEGDHHRGPKPA